MKQSTLSLVKVKAYRGVEEGLHTLALALLIVQFHIPRSLFSARENPIKHAYRNILAGDKSVTGHATHTWSI
jgi:hypothetical protein